MQTIENTPLETASDRIQTSVIMVTPEIAARWLSHNTNNRNIRQTVVARYQADMRNGLWTFAGDPIRFATDGTLLDGQHRLTAVSELEDITVPMVVIRGLPLESQKVMDQGTRRTPGDQLGLAGIPNQNQVAAAVKQYLVWAEGFLFRDSKTTAANITTPRIEQWAAGHLDLVGKFNAIARIVRQNDAPPMVSGAAAFVFLQIDAEAAKEFFTLLSRGAGTHGHPILALDKRLQIMRRQGVKLSNREYLGLIFTAWNAWREDRQLTKLTRPRGGAYSETTFPEPK